MKREIIALYDEYTHAPLDRRTFLDRLAVLAGGAAAASALLPLLESNYARAAIVAPGDTRLATERVSFDGATGPVRGYLARPARGGSRPGVIVVHENRGLNAHIEDVARRVALEGFTALAPDFLSPLGGTPDDPDRARAMFGSLDAAATVGNAAAALAWLRARPDASGRVGAIGFCWGGGMVNRLAVAAEDLAAGVVFYGASPPADAVPRIRARMLMHYAARDQRINAGVPDYEAALRAAGVDHTIHQYPDVDHAFHNDTGAARYDKDAAELAWRRTVAFLKETLGEGA